MNVTSLTCACLPHEAGSPVAKFSNYLHFKPIFTFLLCSGLSIPSPVEQGYKSSAFLSSMTPGVPFT